MTLQLALILVGALVLAAVTGISLWQQRNNQRPLVRLIQVWILQRIENFNLEDVKNWLKPQRLAERLAQREPSLMPSGDFEPSGARPVPSAQEIDEAPESRGAPDGEHPIAPIQSLSADIGGRPLKID